MQQPLAPFVYPDFTQELVSSNGVGATLRAALLLARRSTSLIFGRQVSSPGQLLDAPCLTPYRCGVPRSLGGGVMHRRSFLAGIASLVTAPSSCPEPAQRILACK